MRKYKIYTQIGEDLNHFTETHTTGYIENIGNSFKGIIFGIFLIIGSVILLSYNENRSINETLALEEMESKIVMLEDTKYNMSYENTPVFLQGEVEPITPLEDTLFGVKSKGLILERDVEMYQWVEHKSSKSENKLGGGTETVTTYDYVKEWSSHAIESSSFKHPSEHQNPPMSYSKEVYMTDAIMGDFHLSKGIVSHFPNRKKINDLAILSEMLNGFKNYKSYLYKGENPNTPVIGDVKISYRQTDKGVYSIAGKAQGEAIVPYVSENNRDFIFVREGRVSMSQIFEEEFHSNSILTWILRAVGLMLMFFGFMLIMGPLSTLANVLPIFGSLVEGASSLIAGILTLLIGSIVIAIAWFASRPILSILILGIGIGLTMILSQLKKER